MILVLIIFVSPDLMAEEKEEVKNLLADPDFHLGFNLRTRVKGQPQVIDRLQAEKLIETAYKPSPAWTLSQWHSEYLLKGVQPQILSSGAAEYENEGNKIVIAPPDLKRFDLAMALYGSKEWEDGIRGQGDPWPHLLASQKIRSSPLDQLDEVNLKIKTKLNYCKLYKKRLYEREMHAARYRINFTIQNRNKESEGFGDFYWFTLTLYDNRHEYQPERGRLDKGAGQKKGSGKYIYGPSQKAIMGEKSLHYTDEWVTVKKNLLPYFKKGLEYAWEQGYLQDSRDFGDYVINGFNVGFEITGVFDIEVAIKDLRLDAVPE